MSKAEQKRVRLDKWLWAARFYKTRSLARAAIDGGKVHYNGARVKAGREVAIDAEIELRRGSETWTVHVRKLDDRRRGAPEAVLLYEETAASRARREAEQLQRRVANEMLRAPERRPDKKQRRQIIRFQKQD